MLRKLKYILPFFVGISLAVEASIDTFIPTYETIPCPQTLNVAVGQKIECGYLTVPQSRTQFNGSTIKIFIVTMLSNAKSPQPDPVIYLTGGPGQGASPFLENIYMGGEGLLQNRNVIMVDQRGTGLSQPSLKCSLANELSTDATVKEQVEALKTCYETYKKEKVQLFAYNTEENAADLVDLRKALGIQQWNLLGTSYGTRLSLEIMRQDPEGIRSVVLNSTAPTGVSQLGSEAWYQNTKRVFNLMFADCKADKECNKAFPDLEEKFKALEPMMNKNPIELPYTNPKTLKKEKSSNGYTALVKALSSNLTFMPTRKVVPLYITAVYEYYTKQKPLTLPQEEAIFRQEDGGEAIGMYMSTICHDDYPYTDIEKLEALLPQFYPYTFGQEKDVDSLVEICGFWGAGKATSTFKEPIHSTIPTLLLSGDYDMLTPPAYSEEVASTLPNSRVLSFRGIGHDVWDTNICAHAIVTSFIDNPIGPLEDKCLSYMQQPTFLVPKDYRNEKKPAFSKKEATQKKTTPAKKEKTQATSVLSEKRKRISRL